MQKEEFKKKNAMQMHAFKLLNINGVKNLDYSCSMDKSATEINIRGQSATAMEVSWLAEKKNI